MSDDSSLFVYHWAFMCFRCDKCNAQSPEVRKDNNSIMHNPSGSELLMTIHKAEDEGWYLNKVGLTTVTFAMCPDCRKQVST